MGSGPTIYVLAGVNGSGKSSIGGAVIERYGAKYYNPDLLAKRLREHNPDMTQNIANARAWTLGKEMLETAISKKQTFAFETTLGGITITSLLRKAATEGISVCIWYVGLESVELNIKRVKNRVHLGGHDIPVEKIRERWDTSRRNIISLLPFIKSLHVYDNSKEIDFLKNEKPSPRLLLHIEEKKIIGRLDLQTIPEWAKPIVGAALKMSESHPSTT